MTDTLSITPYHKRLVRATFWMVESKADNTAKVFYNRLFETSPELRPIMKANENSQGRAMIEMVSMLVKGLNTLEVLAPVVRNIGKRYSRYGLGVEHYNMAASALLYSFKGELRENWNEEVEAAWLEVHEKVSEILQTA
ncbi:MAG: globin domain-containing protein [Reichenbachiella sp.]|uniref:globin domain-containing protein n=1 Tax=Reichenbachiella sp. TaxID=2184521 RepID=UPI0032653841